MSLNIFRQNPPGIGRTAASLLLAVLLHTLAAVAAHALFHWPWQVVAICTVCSVCVTFGLLLYSAYRNHESTQFDGDWLWDEGPIAPGAPAKPDDLTMRLYSFGSKIFGWLKCAPNGRWYWFIGNRQLGSAAAVFWMGGGQHGFELGTLTMAGNSDGDMLECDLRSTGHGKKCLPPGHYLFMRK